MKKYLLTILTAATASLLTLPATANENNSKADKSADARNRMYQNSAPNQQDKNSESDWQNQYAETNQLQSAVKASDFVGMTVNNYQDEKLGKVDNVLLDVQSGRIVAIVITSGGFLGMGNELSAVPPTALSFNEERDTLLLDTTKEKLSAAPRFKSDEWPDFSQPMYSESVYRAYNRSPYFNVNEMSDADKTARNERDRNNNAPTSFDQGNSKADTETTAQIRKGIRAGKNMSINAQNVKIITKDGHVTLRGPVNSQEEKRMIGEIANRIARSENVDNQLEVALKTTSK